MSESYIIPKTRRKRNKYHEVEHVTEYMCFYCKRRYPEHKDAKACVDEHNLILVPIAAKDLNRLISYFYLKDEKLLSPNLVRLLKQYVKKQATRR